MYISRSGGSCDCGMAEVMDPEGFCPAHRHTASDKPPAEKDALVDEAMASSQTLRALRRFALAAMYIIGEARPQPPSDTLVGLLAACASVATMHWAPRRLFARFVCCTTEFGLAKDTTWLDVIAARVIRLLFDDHYVTLLCSLVVEVDVKTQLAVALANEHHNVSVPNIYFLFSPCAVIHHEPLVLRLTTRKSLVLFTGSSCTSLHLFPFFFFLGHLR